MRENEQGYLRTMTDLPEISQISSRIIGHSTFFPTRKPVVMTMHFPPGVRFDFPESSQYPSGESNTFLIVRILTRQYSFPGHQLTDGREAHGHPNLCTSRWKTLNGR